MKMQSSKQDKSIKQKEQTFAYQAEKAKAVEERPRTPMPAPGSHDEPIPKIKIKRPKSS